MDINKKNSLIAITLGTIIIIIVVISANALGETLHFAFAIKSSMISQTNIEKKEKICESDICKIDILGIQKPAYDPDPVAVKKGSSIIFNNVDSILHTATSTQWTENERDPKPDDVFDTGILANEQKSKEIIINEPGTYNYYCILHPNDMRGKLLIVE